MSEKEKKFLEGHELPHLHRQPSKARLDSMSLDELFGEYMRDGVEAKGLKEVLGEVGFTLDGATTDRAEVYSDLAKLKAKMKEMKTRITQKAAAESTQSSSKLLADFDRTVAATSQYKEWTQAKDQGQRVYQLEGVDLAYQVLKSLLAPAQEEGQSDGQA